MKDSCGDWGGILEYVMIWITMPPQGHKYQYLVTSERNYLRRIRMCDFVTMCH